MEKYREEKERDFKDKANSLVNWLTSIIISNFVYLINLKENSKSALLLKQWSDWIKWNFICTVVALILIFLFRLFGIVSSRRSLDLLDKGINVDDDNRVKFLEQFREVLIYLFCVSSFLAVFSSVIILWHQLFVSNLS